MQLDDRLRNWADELGADYFGVADLSVARDFIISQGGLEVGSYHKAVSIGIALLNPIVDQLSNRAQRALAIEYRHHAYDVINERLDSIASRLGSILQKEGYRAYPVPASKRAETTSGSALSSPTNGPVKQETISGHSDKNMNYLFVTQRRKAALHELEIMQT